MPFCKADYLSLLLLLLLLLLLFSSKHIIIIIVVIIIMHITLVMPLLNIAQSLAN